VPHNNNNATVLLESVLSEHNNLKNNARELLNEIRRLSENDDALKVQHICCKGSLDTARHRRNSNLSQARVSEAVDDSRGADIPRILLHSPTSGASEELRCRCQILPSS